jgi:cyanophycin synthetase
MDTSRAGYRYQSRAPCAVLEFPIEAWAQPDPEQEHAGRIRVDRWLRSHLEVTVPAAPTAHSAASANRGFLEPIWRALLLGQALRLAGAEPVFEPGRPLLISPDPSAGIGMAIARVAIPAPNRSNIAQLANFYSRCAQLLHQLAHAGTGEMAEATAAAQSVQLVDIATRDLGGLGKSTIEVLKAARALDIPFVTLCDGAFQLGWGSRALRIDRSVTSADSATGARLAQNKAATAALLRKAGLPAPAHRLVHSIHEARAAASAIGWPVVVKPANRERGEGVSTNIASEAQLDTAFESARLLSRHILVERQAAGTCHRIFVAAGKVLYVVRRDARSVTGDGAATVGALIDAANTANLLKPTWHRAIAWPADRLARDTLAGQGLTLDSVPERGRKVALRPIETTRWGGDDEEMTGVIHSENARLAEVATRLLGLFNAGVDLMSTDISRPWYETGAVINEVNFAPALGTAEISRRHVTEFIRRHLRGDGRIPVHVLTGNGEVVDRHALALQTAMGHEGARCWICWSTRTLDPDGREHALSVAGLFDRVQALLLDSRVDALIVRIEDTALLATGLPVDRITTIIALPARIEDEGASGSTSHWARLHGLLTGYASPERVSLLKRFG